MLTVKQVAERLQVTPLTVRRWLKRGELTGIVISDRGGWRIDPESVEQFIARRRPWAPAPRPAPDEEGEQRGP
jgi:excisionase family DNA binding protein